MDRSSFQGTIDPPFVAQPQPGDTEAGLFRDGAIILPPDGIRTTKRDSNNNDDDDDHANNTSSNNKVNNNDDNNNNNNDDHARSESGIPAEEERDKEPIPAWAYHTRGWRYRIKHLTPSWFSVTMGTGIVSVLLYSQPYPGVPVTYDQSGRHNLVWTHYLGIIVFVLNLVLFTAISVATCLRYILYPQIWPMMLRHPVQSLFLGTAPMGFSTIVNMIVMVCVPVWGPWIRTTVWVMWIIDAFCSVACSMIIPFIMMSIHPQSQLQDMTAVWLLPVVASVVASSSGALVSTALTNPQHALWTIVASYILWSVSVPLAFTILVIYFRRLTRHKLPAREVISSVLLPVGPFGQGAFAIINLGKSAMHVVSKTNSVPHAEHAGEILYVVGVLVGLCMWAFGLVCLTFAVASLTRTKVPFNMGSWGFTFPLGVWVMASFAIGNELPSRFFNVVGVIGSVVVIVCWAVIFTLTIRGTISGALFFSPCVAAIESKAQHNIQKGGANGGNSSASSGSVLAEKPKGETTAPSKPVPVEKPGEVCY